MLPELKVIRVAQSCKDKDLKRKLFELKQVEQSWEKVNETVREYNIIRDMEHLFSAKKGNKIHLISGKDGDSARGRGRSPVRGESNIEIRPGERRKGEKDRKSKSKSPSGSRTRIFWNCEEEADHFASICPRKAKQGSGTPFNQSTVNSPNRGASQDRHKTNMIQSGYGSDTDGEDEEECT